MTLDFLVEEGLTDFQKALQRALSNLPTGTERANVARLRSGLNEVLALLNYERADTPVRGLDGPLGQEINGRVVATRNGFEIIHLHLPRLRASVERPAVERVMRQHPQSMVVATSSDPSDEGAWHFVNVKEAGQERKVLRRAVVEPPSVGRTVLETLSQCQVQANQSALDIEIAHDRAFDVEAVSKRFYIEYARQFEQLRDELQTIHGVSKETADGAVQELLNRLIFLMFIQRKSWLPTPENPDRNFLWTEFTQSHRADPSADSYHADFLQPLFLALSRRKEPYARRGIPAEVRQVPFLNGGLFDLDDDSDVLRVPNSAFERLFKDLLLHYNFTIREDTPLEVEVAIDPEMLGRVFENLILQLEKTGEIDPRKATGSYYTPRSIVHFMCQQALKEWIVGQKLLDLDQLTELFSLVESERLGPEEREHLQSVLPSREAKRLQEHILDIAVIDPAVGSGAFLVGMLHEMLAIVRLIDLLLLGQDSIDKRNYDYDRKRAIIERSLYGVDVQTRAVRICELRLWLSLVVDYVLAGSEALPTLPNLTYKVIQGDSLVEHLLGHEIRWMGEPASDRERQLVDLIQAEKADHFLEDDPQVKHQLEVSVIRHTAELAREILGRRDRETQMELGAQVTTEGPDPLLAEIEEVIRNASRLARKGAISGERVIRLRADMRQTFVWRLDFAEVFRRKGGFDIAIANPPYVRIQTLKHYSEELRAAVSRKFHSAGAGNFDLYIPFAELGLALVHASGVFVYIMPNIYMKTAYGQALRQILRPLIRCIVDFGVCHIFENVTNYTEVVVASKKNPPEIVDYYLFKSLESLAEDLTVILGGRAIGQGHLEHFAERRGSLGGTTGSEIWTFLPPEMSSMLLRLQESPEFVPLETIARIFEGPSTGDDKVFVVRSTGSGDFVSQLSGSVSLERQFLKPLIKGRNITSFQVAPTGEYVICPYAVRPGGRATLVDEERLRSEGPSIHAYLSDHRDRLESRERGRMAGPRWFAFSAPRSLGLMEEAKLVTPFTAVDPSFAIDMDGYFFTATAYGVIPSAQHISAQLLLGILNSTTAKMMVEAVCTSLSGGYARFEHRFIKRLPIPVALRDAQCHAIEHAVGELVKDPDNRAMKDKLDSMIAELYGNPVGA